MCESADYASSFQLYTNKYTNGSKDFYYYKEKNRINNSQIIYHHSQEKDSDKEGNGNEE